MRGRGSQGEGGIETPLPLSGFLVTFAPLQKSLAAEAAKQPLRSLKSPLEKGAVAAVRR